MRLHRSESVDDFLQYAGDFLVAREAEHNLLLGICSILQATPAFYPGPNYLATVVEGDGVVLAAMRTPPNNLVLSEVNDPAAIELVVEDRAHEDLPGVVGPLEPARAFADAWTRLTGRPHRLMMAERIFRLTHVRPPRSVPGSLRPIEEADRALVTDWVIAFEVDVFGRRRADDLNPWIDRWLLGEERQMYLWQVDGRPVSMCGVGGRTPNGARIGPVYTPPEERGKGYASACVAAVSQLQLDRGMRFCFLFTDLANPTSNHVYEAIGYEPVRDVDEITFEPA
jgi:predicted GNAT family acetyltransferase